jgi:hypothetical protein
MRLLSRGFPALLLLTSLPVTLPAGDSYCPNADPGSRVVIVSALDPDNSTVPLTAADLRGESRGRPVNIHSIRLERAARVVILLDISARIVNKPTKWRLLLAAASDLVSRLSPDTAAGLVTFDDVVRSTAGIGQGRDALVRNLAALNSPSWSPNPGTYGNPLPEAIRAGLRLLDPAQPGDAIYVITDGWQFGGDIDKGMPEAERTLVASGVRLFATEFEGSGATFLVGGRLMQIVERTGGSRLVFKPSGERDPYSYNEKMAADLSARAATFAAQVQEFYRLEIELPQPVEKLQDWKLEVVDERGRRRKDLTVTYPRRLAPCPPTP